ncbi:DMT family transporter [Streptomyces sp. JJ36]|uniref:DMT family transporter n=1 Tax=Streptomyces sp. JJ36 TaxID=2736645 RepID=UPI001F2A7078|nr:DMT family transporter [Streptomyces sp. JJ36]MCF6523553.1 DMT family transporter [Streptomyces sp. JJ36]
MAARAPKVWTVPVQFVLLALSWGASFLFIKVALEGLAPVQVVAGRLLAGAAVLLLLAAVTRRRLPRQPAVWGHLGVVAVLLCVVPFLLFAWAEQHVSSGLASILNATTPLMTTLVTLVALPEERPDRARLTALALGFGGVVLTLAPWRAAGGSSGAAQAACLAATLCYGTAFVYLRRFLAPRRLPALPVATVQVTLGAALTLPVALGATGVPETLTARVLLSVLALGAAGTGLAYVWNANIVACWGATRASAVTYLTPVVGVALGVVVLGEAPAWHQPAGAVAVVAGVLLGQRGGRPPHRPPTDPVVAGARTRPPTGAHGALRAATSCPRFPGRPGRPVDGCFTAAIEVLTHSDPAPRRRPGCGVRPVTWPDRGGVRRPGQWGDVDPAPARRGAADGAQP